MLAPKCVPFRKTSGWIKLASSCMLPHTYLPIHFASSSVAQVLPSAANGPKDANPLSKSVYLIDYIRKHTPTTLLEKNNPVPADSLRLRLLIPGKFIENIENRSSLKKFEAVSADLQLSEWRWPETVLSMVCPRERLTASLELLVDTLSQNQEVKLLAHYSHAKAIREMKLAKVFASRCPKSTDHVVFVHGEKDHIVSVLHQLIDLIEKIPKGSGEKQYNPINFNKWNNKEYGGYAYFQTPNDFCTQATLSAFVPWTLAEVMEKDGVKAVKSTLWLKNVQIKVEKLKKDKREVGDCGVLVTGKHDEIKGVAYVLKRCLETSTMGKQYLNNSVQPKCSNCGQKGHFSGQCAQPAYCINCIGRNHYAEHCPKLKAAAKADSRKQEVKFCESSRSSKPAKVGEDTKNPIIPKSSCQICGVGQHPLEECPQKDSAPALKGYGSDVEEADKKIRSTDPIIGWI